MKSIFIYIVCITLLISNHLPAQGIKSNCSQNGFCLQIYAPDTTGVMTGHDPLYFMLGKLSIFGIPEAVQDVDACSVEKGVHYTAFFCRMESALRKHFNVWIKFRAGNDDLYREMISGRY